MRSWGCRSCVASLMAAIWATTIEALDFKRYDGVHRVPKVAPPHITEAPALLRRDEQCGASMQLCASSLNGGCCPVNYECETDSCYATTKAPSTCNGRVGWYNCEAIYGAGCCPDGYICDTGDNCLPPSGVSYAYACPTDYSSCPSSLSYGCCPSGMACGTNQCYSTEPVTSTQTVVVTTTESGDTTTYTTTQTVVSTPSERTSLPTVYAGDDSDQNVLKIFPSSIPKESPTSSADNDDNGGLSTGALGGIIAGSVAFLIIVLVAAYIIIRHLNQVVAAVTTSKQSDGSKSRPTMKDFKPTDSEIDAFSVDPLMVPPRPSAPGPDTALYSQGNSEYSSNDHTPSGGITGYHPVATSAGNSRHTSFDAGGDDYFQGTPRLSQSGISANRISTDSHGTYTHVRNYSNASDGSEGMPGWNQSVISELEAAPYVPELPHSPSSVVFPQSERRRSSGSTVNTARPSVSHSRQRNRSESLGQPPLTVVDEEMHGFHGPANQLVGQTDSHRPGTGAGNGNGNTTSENHGY